MAKHIVLEIVDREIDYLVYDTIEDAIQALRDAYEEICSDFYIDDSHIDKSGTFAWANGKFNWDWEIISV